VSLVERHVDFVGALRRAGLRISIAESIDATRAVAAVPLHDREVLRAVYAATLVKRQTDRRAFDTVFDLYYPSVLGAMGSGPEGADPQRPAPLPWEVDDPDRVRLREALREFLLNGDERMAGQTARDAVGSLGMVRGTTGGRPSWSRMTVLDRLSPQTLMHGLLQDFLAGNPGDELAETVARSTINARLARFSQMVETDVARRMAEQGNVEAVARTAARPSIDRVAFLSATRAELADLRREVQPLARRLAARLAYTQRHGRRGILDYRRTIRSSLSSGGVLMDTHHRPRHAVKTNLVILCDISSSVSSFAHFTLLLIYALREQFTRVRAFAFIDELDEVTRFFAPGGDPVEAVTRLTAEADVTWLDGRTDYGRAIELFAERHSDAIGSRTSLLILGDARSNYGDLALPTLRRIVDEAKHAYWLNPERRAAWDTGDSEASRFGEIVPMVECRNLEQLGEFVRGLAQRG
jgi:uncharacterized protein with von Willebrand factor type A (vWA) domain